MARASAARSLASRKGLVTRQPLRATTSASTLGRMNRSKGLLLLGVWVILTNLLPLLSARIPNSGVLLTLLGIVAGVLLLVDR